MKQKHKVQNKVILFCHNLIYTKLIGCWNLFFTALFVNKFLVFNVHWSMHRKNILIYIQQDATLHSLFYLETAVHISGGTNTHH